MDSPAEKPTLQKVRYFHDTIIDEILLDPSIPQGELAKKFGYTQAWMSIIVNSDAFKERLAERKGELVDPKISASINDRLQAIAARSLDRIMDRLDDPVKPIKDSDLAAFAKIGVGDKNTRAAVPTTQNNLYVVALPAPAKNSADWIGNLSQPPHVERAPLDVIRERVAIINTPRGLPLVEEVRTGV